VYYYITLLVVTLDQIKDIGSIIKPEPVVVQTSDEFLAELRSKVVKITEHTPDLTDCRFEFEGGDWITFRTQARADAWVNGNSSTGGFNVNLVFRHGMLDEIGENNARQLAANSLRSGLPNMPVIPYDTIEYWNTVNGKGVNIINKVSVYSVRVTDKMKSKLGIYSKMISVSGKVVTERDTSVLLFE
jgi:hypothetical protein